MDQIGLPRSSHSGVLRYAASTSAEYTEVFVSLQQHPEDELVTIFASHNFDAESEAETVQSLLRSADLESLIVRENVPELPTGRVEVRVLGDVAEEARRIIDEAAREGSGEG